MTDTAVALFAKAPEAGRVKTRLVPPLTHEDAARVARASLEDTIRHVVSAVSVPWTLFLDGEPDRATREIAAEGGLTVRPQEGPELGARLKAAFRALRAEGFKRVLAIGSDSPTLDPERIREAIDSLEVCELTLGPTEDGGYYLIGTSGEDESIFEEIPWGTADAAAATLDRARVSGLTVRLLSPWYDLDDTQALRRAYQAVTSRWALRGVLEGLHEKLDLVSRPASDSRFPA